MPTPSFLPPSTNPFGLTTSGTFANPTFVDIDGDGDLDALIGYSDGNTVLYQNTGNATNPSFVASSTNPFGLSDIGSNANPTLVDIDGDGDLDAFIGTRAGNTVFYQNTGNATSPSFAISSANPFGLSNIGSNASPTFVDIDGDGDLDAFIGERYGNTVFYQNTGNATSPSFAIASTNPFGLTTGGTFVNPTFVDVDGDGDLDALIGTSSGNTRFFRNTGNATSPSFVSSSTNPFGLSDVGTWASPTLVDIDGDGDLDAFVGNSDGNTLFYLNAPAGVTIAQSGGSTTVTEGGVTDSYTLVLTRPPTADVVITLNGSNQASLSTNTLTFTPANWNVAQTVTVTAINDTVGEGTHYAGITHTVTSTDTNYNGLSVTPVRAVITDNDLPVGSPIFTSSSAEPFGLTYVWTSKPTLVDIDGDGDLDAFIGDRYGNTMFYQNTGNASSPSFAAPSTNPFGLTNIGTFASPTLVDIDNDGDLDAFLGTRGGNIRFYRNTGNASSPSFATASTNPFGLVADLSLYATPTLVDIDGDSDLDMLVGYSDGNTVFYRNTGNASSPSFATPSTNPFGLASVGSYAKPSLVDIDGDGDLDALIGNGNGNTRFFRNTGNASNPSFVNAGTNPFGLASLGTWASPVLVDIDADGDFDFFGGTEYNGTVFYRNQSFDEIVTQSGGNTTVSEDGATDSYTLVLTSQPTADVTISLNGGSQLSLSTNTLTFTSTNWNVAQTVTVTAVNDTLAEGTHTGTITHTVTSSDGNYNGNAIADVTATIIDNDIAVSLSVSRASIGENSSTGSVYTFTRNNSAGTLTANFTAGGTATFTTDYTVTGANTFDGNTGSITFANGALTATLTVMPVNDTTVEPDETVTLTLGAGVYQVATASPVTLTLLNDDVQTTTTSLTLVAPAGGGTLVGGPKSDRLTGSDTGNNILFGGGGGDILTGGALADTFRYAALTDSLINTTDSISEFNQSAGDRFQLLFGNPVSLFNAGNLTNSTIASAVKSAFADKDQSTAGAQSLGLNEGVLFGYFGRTYLVVNDGAAGFQNSSDLVVLMSKFTFAGSDATQGILSVSNYFV